VDARIWDDRYSARDLVWSAEPNQFVEHVVGGLEPGRALDLAAGEGRNAIWMARRGWQVDAVDYSGVAIERAARLAAEAGVSDRVTTQVADIITSRFDASYDLALLSYLQLPADQMHTALLVAVDAVKPGGHVLVVGHAHKNLTEGYGGPQDPAVLYDPPQVVRDAEGLPVTVHEAELRERVVTEADGVERVAIDTIVLLERT
jgi:SAM-dependent methyltransferase